MPKHHRRLRKSIESVFESHIAPEKSGELEKNRTDIEGKVTKIFKLIKEENGEDIHNSSKESELVNLIEDIQKEYQSLHESYNHLTGELRKRAKHKEHSDGNSSSSSSSDSESDHSSKENGSKNNKENELQNQIETLEQHLKTTTEEKDALNLAHFSALSKTQEAEKILEALRKSEAELHRQLEESEKVIKDLRLNADQVIEEKSQLWSENVALKQEMEAVSKQVTTLNQTMEGREEVNQVLASKNSEILIEVEQAQKVIQELKDEAKQLEERLENKESTHSALEKKHEDFENNMSVQMKDLATQVNKLQLELESLSTQKNELEVQVKVSNQEAEQLREDNSGLLDQISALEGVLKERENDLAALQMKLEDGMNEATSLIEQVEAKKIEATKEKELLLKKKDVEIAALQRKQSELLGEITWFQAANDKHEVTLRLLNRRVKVAEQTLAEKEATYRKVEKDFYDDRHLLEDIILKLTTQVESTTCQLTDIKDTMGKTSDKYSELELATQKLMENNNSFQSRISGFSEELRIAKDWVQRKNNEKQELQKVVQSLGDELSGTKVQELTLQVRVRKLEVSMEEEHREKEILKISFKNLEQKVTELKKRLKEMKEIKVNREEEKREAIRQLCLWIDYHREENNHLKVTLSKMWKENQRAT